MKMSERIRQCMKALNITQSQLAERCHCTSGTISHYLNDRRGIRLDIIEQIAKSLDASPEWIAFGTGQPPIYLKIPFEITKGRVPFIEWYQVPNVCKNPDSMHDSNLTFIELTFQAETNLFATKIPDTKIPGQSSELFDPKDLLLISTKRPPVHDLPVVISSEHWLEPEYAIYWLHAEQPCLRYPSERRLRRLTDNIHICGAVVARLNIFI